MSTDEIYRGFDHGDPTEAWRVDAVHRVETGTVLVPPELTTDEFDYLLRHSRVSTPWVIVGLLVVGNLITGALLLVGA